MRTVSRRPEPFALSTAGRPAVIALALLLPAAIGAADGVKVDPRAHLGELARLGARRPFLVDSPVVYLESRETSKTLPGVMVEAYLRNARQRKSFFIRYGVGTQRGLAAAIRLSAEMLVSQLETRRRVS